VLERILALYETDDAFRRFVHLRLGLPFDDDE
jgi:hypothetical protein